MSNLATRVLSALILIPALIYIVHLGGLAIAFFLVFAAGVSLYEYSKIVAGPDRLARAVVVLSGVAACGLGMWVSDPAAMLLLVEIPALCILLLFTLRTGDMDTVWTRMAALAFAVPYIVLAHVTVFKLREMGESGPATMLDTAWVWLPLIATWSNDTCAYFAGRAFGRTKLYPKVSPKKTWEGAVGGAAGALLLPYAFFFALGTRAGTMTPIDVFAVGLGAAFLAPLGDLAESLLKRSFDTKDSGGIIPGHGGLLDRVDAVYFVAPWTLLYLVAIRPLIGP